MLVSLKLFLDVTGHRNVECSSVVVPGEFDAAVEIAAPIFAQFFVLILYCCDQMIHILLSCVLDTKIIDDEGEGDWAGLVFPKAGRVLALVVPVGLKLLAKEFVCQDAGLR